MGRRGRSTAGAGLDDTGAAVTGAQTPFFMVDMTLAIPNIVSW